MKLLPGDEVAGDQPTRLPYCGIYSLYAAGKYLNQPISDERLVQEKYVSQRMGSTAEDLVAAAADLGLVAEARAGLASSDLKRLSHPALLHTLATDASQTFDHWIAYFGVSAGGEALIFDPYRPAAQTIPFHDLIAQWDGIAIVVNDSQLDPPRSLAGVLGSFPLPAIVAVLVIILLIVPAINRCLRSSSARGGRVAAASIARLITVLLIGLCAASVVHLFGDEGFWKGTDATRRVR